MTVTYPYSLSTFALRLPITAVEWDVQRNDILSGQGSGRIWQSEIAPPLWTADVELDRRNSQEMKQYAALIRRLNGSQDTFMLFDPISPYPQTDPKGILLGASAVKIASLGSDNASIALKGLPAGYVLTLGDKMQIPYGTNPVRHAFFEFSETGAANGAGTTAELSVYPHLPIGLAVDLPVILARPACLMKIKPTSHRPGRARRHYTEGAAFAAIQAV